MNLPKQTFSLTVTNKDKIIFTGKIHALSSKNTTGPFDILATHTSFITLVTEKLDFYPSESAKKQTIPLTHGILHVNTDSTAFVYLISD